MTLQKLAIYYGYPTLVNDARGEVGKGVKVFAQFSHVVLGGGLEKDGNRLRPKHPDRKIIEQAPETEFFGYVNLGITNSPEPHSMDEIRERIAAWKEMGVAGIFFDAVGFEYGVTRERQNEAIRGVHELSLKAFVNCHRPDDVFGEKKIPLNSAGGGNVSGLKPEITGGDLYLFESFVIAAGLYQDPAFMREKLNALQEYKKSFRVNTFGVGTFEAISDATEPHLKHFFYCAVLAGFDGIGVADPVYAATSNRLYLYTPSYHREA